MTAIRRFRLPRFVAAALAALGLMASSKRTLLACTMPGAESVAVAEVDPHAHHHGSAAVDVGAPADDSAERAPAPQHERCPDLAHCAMMAWTPLPPVLPNGDVAPERSMAAADERPLSVGRAIDTPPPKRG